MIRSLLAGALLLLGTAAPASAAVPVSDEAVTAIARQLRCVVCQNLSVADSPSEMAQQMRDLIRERLAQGESPREVVAYFVDRYGQWVLLAPPARGFNLLVWILPFAGLAAGGLVAVRAARRWARRDAGPPGSDVAPADRERVRRALAELED